ncbi:hypothetical protein VaNZ11_000872 [Volvox africanus]|uniref:Suppressor of forked domain-containing protein n=1 Tax=Volvox africanus TaxID=51714 RepID=A0ABQ5RP12_9CHLO|nr:hypothetical protein VaNZ11_000872 [Volvox africanus]
MTQETGKDVPEEEVLRNPDLWDKAGIPWPQAKRIKLPTIVPKLVSEPVGIQRQVKLLEELMPWCVIRRDYGAAMRLCYTLLLRLKEMYLRKQRHKLARHYFQDHRKTLLRWLGCCAEVLLATGFTSCGAVLEALRIMVFSQVNFRQAELMAADLAVHLLEEGEVHEAERVLALHVCTIPETTKTRVPRLSVQGFLDYTNWMRCYLRHVQEVAEAQVGCQSEDEEEASGRLGPLRSEPAAARDRQPHHHELNGWEYVPKAWSRANAEMDFREHWQKCEQCLKQLIMHHPARSTKLAYYLAQTYCAAGQIDRAVWIGAWIASTTPGDPDAVALAVLMSQLMDTYVKQLSRLDAAAALPPGTAATLLRLTCVRSHAEADGGAGCEGGMFAARKRLQRSQDDANRDAEEDGEQMAEEVRNTKSPAARIGRTGKRWERGTGAAALLSAAASRRRGESNKMEGPPLAAEAAPAAAEAAAVWEPGPAPSTSQPRPPPAEKQHQQPRQRQQPEKAVRTGVKQARLAAKTAGDGGSMNGGDYHDRVKMQLDALQSDPLCGAALAGLACSGNHCSYCAVALVRGCLLHLDSCTTGVVFSSYEVDVWARLDSALQELAAMVAAAPRGPQRTAARNTQCRVAGDAAAEDGRSRKRKRDDDDGSDEWLEPVMLWQKRVVPELRGRAEWWVHVAFSEPPVLFSRDGTASDGGTLFLLPDEALIKHLQHRASVAAVMMGPHNYYTQHVLREMQLLRQTLKDHLAAARRPRKNVESSLPRRHQQTQRNHATSSEMSGEREEDGMEGVEDDAAGDDAEILEVETALATVDSCIEAVTDAVDSITALVRRLAPPPLPQLLSRPWPLPPALMASVPRALRRGPAPTNTEAAAAVAATPVA